MSLGGGGVRPLSVDDARYQQQIPNLVAPCPPQFVSGVNASAANRMSLCRVIVPKTGVLHDLSVILSTVAGNVLGAVYDTGDALAGSASLLWSGVSTPATGGGLWMSLGDPALNVTAGQQLNIGFNVDSASPTFGRVPLVGSSVAQLPANFWPCAGGLQPKFSCFAAVGSLTAPATIAEASLTASSVILYTMARVV